MHNRQFKFFLAVFLFLVLLAGCKENRGEVTANIPEDKIKVTRNTIEFRLEVKDPQASNDKLNASIRVYAYEYDENNNEKTTDSKTITQTVTDVKFENLDAEREYRILVKKSSGENADLLEKKISTNDKGTEKSPILISTIDEFLAIEDDLSASYKLMNDLDFSTYKEHDGTIIAYRAIGTTSKKFEGKLDGNNKVIKNIKNFDLTTSNYSIGLFSCIGTKGEVSNLQLDNIGFDTFKAGTTTIENKSLENFGAVAGKNLGTIKNVHLKNLNVQVGSSRSNTYMGGLTGTNDFKIISSSVKSSSIVISSSNNLFVGSICGLMSREEENTLGEINKTYAEDVTLRATSTRSEISIGGLVGENRADIRNSYFEGSINAESTNTQTTSYTNAIYAGGVVGKCTMGIVEYVYNAGDITISTQYIKTVYAGGIVGSFSSDGRFAILKDSYNLGNIKLSFAADVQHSAAKYNINALYGAGIYLNDVEKPLYISNVKTFNIIDLVIWVNNEQTRAIYPDSLITVEITDLNNKDFYLDTVHFSEVIWDLTNLNNGRLKLK